MKEKRAHRKLRILITGSSGEIGTNLALRLLREGHKVFGVDKRKNTWTDAIPTILQDLSEKFRPSASSAGIGDLHYPKNLDLVVHLAANAKVHELVLNPSRAMDNILMTLNVLEFSRKRQLPIIFASSREIYGDLRRDRTKESQTHILDTESPYSASKISGEAFLYSYARCYDIPYIVFRFSNVYGRFDNDRNRMERVIPLFIEKIIHGKKVEIFGKEKVLDFTYVDDCVDGIVRGITRLSRGKVKNETINIAYGQGHSLADLFNIICRTLGKKSPATFHGARRGEIVRYVANISKARKILGFNPKIHLEAGIRLAVKNYGYQP